MYTCEECGCNYDAGEIKGRICIDCVERQQKRARHMEAYRRIMHQSSYQLMFDMNGCQTVKDLRC